LDLDDVQTDDVEEPEPEVSSPLRDKSKSSAAKQRSLAPRSSSKELLAPRSISSSGNGGDFNTIVPAQQSPMRMKPKLKRSNTIVDLDQCLKSWDDQLENLLDNQIESVTSRGHLCSTATCIFKANLPWKALTSQNLFRTSAKRTMIFICYLNGTLAAVVFFTSPEASPKGEEDKACDFDDAPLWYILAQRMFIVICASVLACIPIEMMTNINNRDFVMFAMDDERGMNKQLRKWRIQDRVYWFMTISYNLACVGFCFLFVANVSDKDIGDVLMTVGIQFGEEFILVPFGIAITMFLLIAVITMHGPSVKSLVMEQLAEKVRRDKRDLPQLKKAFQDSDEEDDKPKRSCCYRCCRALWICLCCPCLCFAFVVRLLARCVYRCVCCYCRRRRESENAIAAFVEPEEKSNEKKAGGRLAKFRPKALFKSNSSKDFLRRCVACDGAGCSLCSGPSSGPLPSSVVIGARSSSKVSRSSLSSSSSLDDFPSSAKGVVIGARSSSKVSRPGLSSSSSLDDLPSSAKGCRSPPPGVTPRTSVGTSVGQRPLSPESLCSSAIPEDSRYSSKTVTTVTKPLQQW